MPFDGQRGGPNAGVDGFGQAMREGGTTSMSGDEIDDFLAMVAQSSPNGRIAAPEDVAALVLFLASDAASHITGTNIPCDGGVMA